MARHYQSFEIEHQDIWGNDEEGYEFNDVYTRFVTSIFAPEGDFPSTYQLKKLFGSSARIEYNDGNGISVSVSEGVDGRRHVPKYYLKGA